MFYRQGLVSNFDHGRFEQDIHFLRFYSRMYILLGSVYGETMFHVIRDFSDVLKSFVNY